MFTSYHIVEDIQNGSPAPTCALKWLPCGEWFGIPEEETLIYPFLKIGCSTTITTCLNPQDQLIEMHPDMNVVRLIPETVTFKTASLL